MLKYFFTLFSVQPSLPRNVVKAVGMYIPDVWTSTSFNEAEIKDAVTMVGWVTNTTALFLDSNEDQHKNFKKLDI